MMPSLVKSKITNLIWVRTTTDYKNSSAIYVAFNPINNSRISGLFHTKDKEFIKNMEVIS